MTYGALQSTIADDIARTDLTVQIKAAIQRAIKFYERSRFYFNERDNLTFSVATGQEYYGNAADTDIPLMVQVDSVQITMDQSIVPLTARDSAYLDVRNNSLIGFGDPVNYGYYNQQFRFSPIPQLVRTITVSGVLKLPALVNDSDTNAWVEDAEELIRARAKRDLFRNTIRDFDEANVQQGEEQIALSALVQETEGRIVGGTNPTRF